MTICTEVIDAQLQGDLTLSGVNGESIYSLEAALRQLESGTRKNIRIDCARIRVADISGLRLLYVWLHCFRFRGVEPELVNLSCGFQQAIQSMGIWHCFSGDGAHT